MAAFLEHATCGNDECFLHRLPNETIQDKYIEKVFRETIGEAYTVAELGKLRQVANGMG